MDTYSEAPAYRSSRVQDTTARWKSTRHPACCLRDAHRGWDGSSSGTGQAAHGRTNRFSVAVSVRAVRSDPNLKIRVFRQADTLILQAESYAFGFAIMRNEKTIDYILEWFRRDGVTIVHVTGHVPFSQSKVFLRAVFKTRRGL